MSLQDIGLDAILGDGAPLATTRTSGEGPHGHLPIDARMLREPARPYAVTATQGEAGEGDRRAIAELLGPTPVAIDELVRQSGQPAAAVQLVLLELELAGRIERHAGARISLM